MAARTRASGSSPVRGPGNADFCPAVLPEKAGRFNERAHGKSVRIFRGQGFPVYQDLALGGNGQAAYRFEQDGLAGAVASHQARDLPRRKFAADAVQDFRLAKADR